MPLDPATQSALANEVRRQSAALQVHGLRGQMQALASAAQVISSLSQDAAKSYAAANQEMAALQLGAGPGLTGEFGPYSAIDQLLRKERFAGKSASIDAIQANPEISQADAEVAWVVAARAATGLERLGVEPGFYGAIYRKQLHAAGRIAEPTWEAQRAWIVATDKAEIMGI